jgi:hypothetical protein
VGEVPARQRVMDVERLNRFNDKDRLDDKLVDPGR